VHSMQLFHEWIQVLRDRRGSPEGAALYLSGASQGSSIPRVQVAAILFDCIPRRVAERELDLDHPPECFQPLLRHCLEKFLNMQPTLNGPSPELCHHSYSTVSGPLQLAWTFC